MDINCGGWSRWIFPVVFVFSASAGWAPCQGDALNNGDFEDSALAGPGQSPVPAGGAKALAIDPLDSRYPNGISGVPFWINSFSDVGFGAGVRDAGLRRIDFDGSGDTQYAFINNHETRLSQVTTHVVAPGEQYTAHILVGFIGPQQAGRFQLWAGTPDPTNPDNFPATSVLLSEISAGTAGYTFYQPDVELSASQWHPLQLTYSVPASGSMIGQPLTISFLTSNHSAGPTLWDNAELEAVPEPSTVVLALLSIGFTCWAPPSGIPRRRRAHLCPC